MARPAWLVLALALAAAGCGPYACEFFTGHPEDDYCIEVGANPFGSDTGLSTEACTLHEWQSCSDIGYVAPCTRIDGTPVWKRFGARCGATRLTAPRARAPSSPSAWRGP